VTAGDRRSIAAMNMGLEMVTAVIHMALDIVGATVFHVMQPIKNTMW